MILRSAIVCLLRVSANLFNLLNFWSLCFIWEMPNILFEFNFFFRERTQLVNERKMKSIGILCAHSFGNSARFFFFYFFVFSSSSLLVAHSHFTKLISRLHFTWNAAAAVVVVIAAPSPPPSSSLSSSLEFSWFHLFCFRSEQTVKLNMLESKQGVVVRCQWPLVRHIKWMVKFQWPEHLIRLSVVFWSPSSITPVALKLTKHDTQSTWTDFFFAASIHFHLLSFHLALGTWHLRDAKCC